MNQKQQNLNIIGVASCYGAQDLRCASGPLTLKQLSLKTILEDKGWNIHWDKNIYPASIPTDQTSSNALILDICKQLARQTRQFITQNQRFVVIGGDHSCAIGTWSGVHSALTNTRDFGLIWIDAHMDSHTLKTSPSGAIHGMPLAALLGFGDPEFCNIESIGQKIKPRNLCLVGIRSFEQSEADLLNKLGVKVFYMHDVHALGLPAVLQLAKKHVCKHNHAYGMSIDLDAIDPTQAPGVGSPEKYGLNGKELVDSLTEMDFSHDFLGLEIAELNADKDEKNKTAKLAISLIQAAFS